MGEGLKQSHGLNIIFQPRFNFKEYLQSLLNSDRGGKTVASVQFRASGETVPFSTMDSVAFLCK